MLQKDENVGDCTNCNVSKVTGDSLLEMYNSPAMGHTRSTSGGKHLANSYKIPGTVAIKYGCYMEQRPGAEANKEVKSEPVFVVFVKKNYGLL